MYYPLELLVTKLAAVRVSFSLLAQQNHVKQEYEEDISCAQVIPLALSLQFQAHSIENHNVQLKANL